VSVEFVSADKEILFYSIFKLPAVIPPPLSTFNPESPLIVILFVLK